MQGSERHQNGIRILSAATDHLVRACTASADGFGHRHGGYLPMPAGSAVSRSVMPHGMRAEIGRAGGGRQALTAVAESSPKSAGGGSVRRERRCRQLWRITVGCAGSIRWFYEKLRRAVVTGSLRIDTSDARAVDKSCPAQSARHAGFP